MQKEIRVIILNNETHQTSTIFRLDKNCELQFRFGPTLFGRKVELYSNYPTNSAVFQRDSYSKLNWTADCYSNSKCDSAKYANISTRLPGSYHFYFTFEDSPIRQGSGYFIVDPEIHYGINETLPLDSIQCQTVLAKLLGDFPTWESKLLVSRESGYNMIHFSPIQELGPSNSGYSLSDQLKLNPIFGNISFGDVEEFIMKIRRDWKVTSICDLVLNHTANESIWLQEHPEASYNCLNCPYMRPAYLLDAAMSKFSKEINLGYYKNKGIPKCITDENHLNAIRGLFHNEIIPVLKLQEMFICDVNKYVAEFSLKARRTVPKTPENLEILLIQDKNYERLTSCVDMEKALTIYNQFRNDCFDEETRLKKCIESFKTKLDELNGKVIEKLNNDLNAAIENIIAHIRYNCFQQDGPKNSEITKDNPLVPRYFTDYKTGNFGDIETVLFSANSSFLMAHNGWVMNSDPLSDFGKSNSVYLRRELIAWSDSVKLRYGDKPEDSPHLWRHMREYVEQTARIFDGIRLDNCHSTPLHVAEHLLDYARKIRPDLYVVAELFTNSDEKDNVFVNRLGITSLIRESMSAWDSHELGRLVYRYGGASVGAFYQLQHNLIAQRPLTTGGIAHALLLDLTHDNRSPRDLRSVYDQLPNAALVAMACCASGSTRGYDELVDHQIHVVNENREYTEWTNNTMITSSRFVNKSTGLIQIKQELNNLHFYLGNNNFDQVFVDQIDFDIVAVTRHNSLTHESVILVAFTAFQNPPDFQFTNQRFIKPIKFDGELSEVIFEASYIRDNNNELEIEKDAVYINATSTFNIKINKNIPITQSEMIELTTTDNEQLFSFKCFKPGNVVAVKISPKKETISSVDYIKLALIASADNVKSLSLTDLNILLYRCNEEEKDDGNGFGVYDIPGFGPLVYCGLQGFISAFTNIKATNDLGHPICNNLREGNWMIDYIWQRLAVHKSLKPLSQWISDIMNHLKKLPRYLIPTYFDLIITHIFTASINHAFSLMNNFVQNGSSFIKLLSLGSVQFAGVVKSAQLPQITDKTTNEELHGTLSAGLPHFTTGYTRNWGRDTFIALRGTFILTGRFAEAKQHILAYGACLRHGLIPNLLDGGKKSRFNCRDAIWWWLYAIKSYVIESPESEGTSLLSETITRLFPLESSKKDQSLAEVMQEALEIHFQGLVFRELNAGREIDAHMTDAGFNNQIGIHPETGFVFGGNVANCGTWMDKMGSSVTASTLGKPSTPRDGSAVELIGLSYSVITWLSTLPEAIYPYRGVSRHNKDKQIDWSWIRWADKIRENFERCFWIGEDNKEELVNKRGIYKDCYGATQKWTDYQLRCNFPIAMVAAPELFNPKLAWTALENAEKYLLSPLGMKTLDSSDYNYCGDYNNADNSDNAKISHGFNYHNGPEWVWPIGYFLRAKLHFAREMGELPATLSKVRLILSRHLVELQTSVWRGLPELTNTEGAYCADSSRTQAWSMACVLEVLHELNLIDCQEQ